MTATIREANVFTDLHLCIYGKISAISDPVGKSKWIYSTFPEKSVDKKGSYPLIVIHPADVSYDPLTFTDLKRGPVNFAIEVYTISAERLDSISSSILDKMESEEDNFLASGVSVMRLVGTSYVHYERDGFRVHNKTINYAFDFGWF